MKQVIAVFTGLMVGILGMNGAALDVVDYRKTLDDSNLRMMRDAGDSALSIGLYEVADSLYGKVYEQGRISERSEVARKWVRALISRGKYEKAGEVLAGVDDGGAEYLLMRGMVAYHSGDIEGATNYVSSVSSKELVGEDLAWHYLLRGLVAQRSGRLKEARGLFKQAVEVSESEALRGQLDALIFRVDIFSEEASEEIATKLRRKLNKGIGKEPAVKAVKQYAIVMDMLGNKGEAIRMLEIARGNLSHSQRTKGEEDELLLLLGLVATGESERGEMAYKEILMRGQSVEASRVALSLLVQGKVLKEDRRGLLRFLDELVGVQSGSSLMDRFLMTRAQVGLLEGEYELARGDAERVLEEYPASVYRERAHQVLAYTAWGDEPPRYRDAADALGRLIEEVEDVVEKTRLSVLVGDCYYLNKDYGSAAEVYGGIMRHGSGGEEMGAVLFQWVLSYIEWGKLGEAERVLDMWSGDARVDSMYVWRAEWNLIRAIKSTGDVAGAFNRVRKLMVNGDGEGIAPELALRLVWLKAQLSLETGKVEEVPELADRIMDLLDAYEDEEMGEEQERIIASHTLLLKAQALLRLEQEDEGLKILKRLREGYPDSNPAILSYITEARYYSMKNRVTKAQQQLIRLSDRYPESEYATVALYEAALNAEARGMNSTYQEALGILERLSMDYPESPLVFYAREKQGDILRKMGKFGDAELIYKNLASEYPKHVERARVELSWADCLMAHAVDDNGLLSEAAMRYERLFDMGTNGMGVRVEAGFKTGFALMKGRLYKRAQEAFWLVITNFLNDGEMREQLDEGSRYWVARSVFELGGVLEKQGKVEQANQVYGLIGAYELPGVALAEAKIKK